MLRYLAASVVVGGCVAGLALGYYLPLRRFGEISGFSTGILCGAFVTVIGAMLTASLFGGKLEILIGTTFGVPLGAAIGSFVGSIVMNCVVGFTSALLVCAFRKAGG
jgi:hypothetical protein